MRRIVSGAALRKPARRAVTVRVPERRLRWLQRARKLKTQSDLINTLLEEEEERIRSYRALRSIEGTAGAAEIDDRLL